LKVDERDVLERFAGIFLAQALHCDLDKRNEAKYLPAALTSARGRDHSYWEYF
jgi:hypothetical protein